MQKRGLFGIPTPVILGLGIFLLLLVILGLLSGPIGKTLLPGLGLPSWLSVPSPEPELPAEEVFTIFGYPVTNSVLGAWFTIVVVTLLCWLATRRMKMVPGRFQSVFEAVIGWLYGLCASVAGEKNGRRFFPVVATIFLFVAFNAWLGLIPGFGSILVTNSEGLRVPLLRAANTDLNMPLALAVVSFIFVEYSGLRSLGIRYLTKFFNFGPLLHVFGRLFRGHFNMVEVISGFVGVFVGALELLSEIIRLLSLSFRLFGNMTAGEILLLIVSFLVPFVVSDVFYGLELLIGFVQALIFAGLTLVYLVIATAAHDAEHGAEHAHQ